LTSGGRAAIVAGMLSRLHVEQLGAGAPVVLLHSSGLSGRQWRRLARAVAEQGFRVVVPDLTGHGASPAWPEPKPFAFRRDVDEVVTLLSGGAATHLVGHSYGGLVALHAALAAPSSVRSLTLFDPVAFGSLDPVADADARAELAGVDLVWGTTPEEHERWLAMFVDYWGGAGAWAALREEARAEFRRVGWVVHEGATSLVDDQTPATAYRAVTVPLRLVSGEHSPLAARRVVQLLGEAVPGSTVIVIPQAGHMAPLSHADQVNAEILAGLAAAEATTRS
jgi:pimeloyl-ACP methyl ester carboxylesterase